MIDRTGQVWMDGDGDIFVVLSSRWASGWTVHHTMTLSVISVGHGIVPGMLFPFNEIDGRWDLMLPNIAFKMQRIL